MVQFKPNLLWRTSTRNSTSFNLKLFAANLTPGLAQPPSSARGSVNPPWTNLN